MTSAQASARRTKKRPAPKIRNPLGPFALIHPEWLALKSGIASLVAFAMAVLAGCPDLVSTCFVAVLCVSPAVVMGLRQAMSQLAGSLIGGVAGTAMLAAGVPPMAGVPLAVGTSVYAAFALRYPQGYPVAAFTALFVQVVPRATPLETLGVRMQAVLLASLSGFVVNLLVSSRAYKTIYTQRLRRVEEHADKLLVEAVEHGPRCVQAGFAMLSLMESELAQTQQELEWRRDHESARWLRRIAQRVYAIHHLLHLIYDLGLLMQDHDVEDVAVEPFLYWVRCGEGTPPAVPAPLQPCAARIEELWQELHKRVPDPQ